MKSFIKIVLGSCLGVIVATLVVGLILSGIGAAMFASDSDQGSIKANSVLQLSLKDNIPQKTGNTEEAMFNFSDEPIIGQFDMIQAIEAAAEDKNIKGLYLTLGSKGVASAKAQDIRNAIISFKESGKFVYAYCGNYGYGQSEYYIASAADKVFIHPLGAVDFRGFGSEIPFFKDMLDKIGVKMATFYAGKYKGATEPLRLNKMSDENRLQIKTYLSALYESFLNDIGSSRDLSRNRLSALASELGGRTAEMALENGLVDEIKYADEVLDALREALDLDEDEKIPLISVVDYHKERDKDRNLGSNAKVAVLYAEGEIRAGKETYGMITDQHYVDMIRKIGKDDKVKAVVIRINSPGGDAFVSDEIWRELELLQEKDITVVASMADIAASGGYYIACGADEIIAEANTITGSIGVFGVIPNVQELMNDKLGIHMDTVKTERYATGVVSSFYPIGKDEAKLIQESIDRIYRIFLDRVAEGRQMSIDDVHEIAQGRIWTGAKAKEIGLVDRLGDLDYAIARAVEIAEIEDYRITEYPRIKDPMQKLLEELTSSKGSTVLQDRLLKTYFPSSAALLMEFEQLLNQSNRPMARLPFAGLQY
ncbi:MAG: signal peptide peptidase SppA [Saprospiraceae bacterium]|nr:signal peptide peptidase SppA [Saprospiraceae bacterium]